MATTVQQILDAAYATSKANRPGTIASETTELLQVVQRSLRMLFADAVEHNRVFYVTRQAVAWDAILQGWPMPKLVEAVIRIERATGVQVAEVPFDDRRAELGKPAVFMVGQVFYPAGNALDPVNETLTMFCSKMPATLSSLDSTLDPLWPEQFNQVLIWDVAQYLAVKDGREGEAAAFTTERDREHARYVNFLRHATTTLVRRYGHDGRANTQQTITP